MRFDKMYAWLAEGCESCAASNSVLFACFAILHECIRKITEIVPG
jgi:hypothetical protein